MIIMGIDQAFNHSSYAIFDDDKYITSKNYVAVGKEEKKTLTKAGEKLPDEEKYKRFYNFLQTGIDKHNPDLVICEAAYCGPNKRVFGLISQLIGMIRSISFISGREFHVVPPATYRSKLGLKNNKLICYEYVSKEYPDVEIDKEYDIADAILLAKYASQELILENKLNVEA